jgi:FtsP/CotA-like multicopper oxidase with cupredoxin domain
LCIDIFRSFRVAVMLWLAPLSTLARTHADVACPRPAPGSVVAEPADLESRDGVLQVDLTYRKFTAADGQERYCYQARDGSEAPTLRLHPGDLLVLRLKNRLTAAHGGPGAMAIPMTLQDPCAAGQMTALSTNLHFHGMTVPPVCHEDDVLHTVIAPGAAAFEYRFRIPADESPGLHWYHPHVHGFTRPQVLGGASGALIVEGIERANKLVSGLPERVFVIRDQALLKPDAPPAAAGAAPPVLRDPEGDILNTGTGGGKPDKDLSINFVPTPYPDYPPAVIMVKPSERQLWRVVNSSSVTYLDLQVVVNGAPQTMGVVALDGKPINENGLVKDRVLWVEHIFLPPSARVELIFKGVPVGAHARLITRSVDTGPAGENDPTRPLADIVASDKASEPVRHLGTSSTPLPRSSLAWLGDVKPVRTRTLFFSEQPVDPKHPEGLTAFMITVEGQAAAPFDPSAAQPNITVNQGDVEDWVLENRSREAHAFHIHQVHFMLMKWDGVPVEEPFLKDTINVPYWDGKSRYPSVTLRMDFRNPNAVGMFVYHCHLLEHEDMGMMGTIRVLPAPQR